MKIVAYSGKKYFRYHKEITDIDVGGRDANESAAWNTSRPDLLNLDLQR